MGAAARLGYNRHDRHGEDSVKNWASRKKDDWFAAPTEYFHPGESEAYREGWERVFGNKSADDNSPTLQVGAIDLREPAESMSLYRANFDLIDWSK